MSILRRFFIQDEPSLPISSHKLVSKINNRLQLRLADHPELKPLYVDFLEGALAHRRQYGGGKNQLIAKAVGLNKQKSLTVLDISAGLARDAFILASLGANVTAIERQPIIAALVKDAFERANQDSAFRKLAFRFIEADAVTYLTSLTEQPDVIYFDPMFPERSKSALVKKAMRMLKDIVGDDPDADTVFKLALTKAKKRVVVKRPQGAPPLNQQAPDLVYKGKSTRFDVYFIRL